MAKLLHSFAAILVSISIVSLATGQDAKREGKTKAKQPALERIVIPAPDVTEFSVKAKTELFRLEASTIAGGTIGDPVILGKAKLVRSAEIVTVGKGGAPLLGTTHKEFVFRGTASGPVKIQIKTTSPTSPKPVIKVYQVTVK